MTGIRYQSHIYQLATGPAFAEGHGPNGVYWLAGASGQKKEVLLTRLSALLNNTQAPAQAQIAQTIEEFYDWFREAYQQAKRSECVLSDEQIVGSIGVAWLNNQGSATLYSQGTFQFYSIDNDKLSSVPAGYQQLRFRPGSLLVADPSQSDIAQKVVNEFRRGGGRWEVLSTVSYNFPVAVVHLDAAPVVADPVNPVAASVSDGHLPSLPDAEPIPDPSPIPWGRVVVLVTMLLALLAGGYYVLMPWLQSRERKEVVTEPTTIAPATDSTRGDTTVIDPDTTQQLNADDKPADRAQPTTKPGPKATTATTLPVRPQDPVQPDPADEYWTAGVEAYNKAEGLRKAGKYDEAETQYDRARGSFNRFSKLRPRDTNRAKEYQNRIYENERKRPAPGS